MARESQGLQIALIIFVMLTVVMSVTTFIFYRRYDEALRAAKAKDQEAIAERTKTAAKETECGKLKRMIGLATKSIEEIEAQFDADMKLCSATNYPEDARFYSPILKSLYEVIHDKEKDLEALSVDVKRWQEKYVQREAEKDLQIKQFDTKMAETGQEVKKIIEDYKTQREQALEHQAEMDNRMERIRRESKLAVDKAEENVKKAQTQWVTLSELHRAQARKLEKLTRPTMDTPAGEIRWVNQHNGTVWINLGRADALERQISFSVYSADSADLGKATRKASIEVTKILGDHLAEARVLEDKVSDPVMPGDKIHTPLWTPGEQTRFALAGFMDLDGDGRNAMQTVRNLITMNGGVIDCELTEQGKRVGEMTINTRYLVLGDEPSARGQTDAIQNYSRMIADAEKLNIRKMSLAELKQKMGYKKQTSVEHFGRVGTAGNSPRSKAAAGQKAAGGAAFKKSEPSDAQENNAFE